MAKKIGKGESFDRRRGGGKTFTFSFPRPEKSGYNRRGRNRPWLTSKSRSSKRENKEVEAVGQTWSSIYGDIWDEAQKGPYKPDIKYDMPPGGGETWRGVGKVMPGELPGKSAKAAKKKKPKQPPKKIRRR